MTRIRASPIITAAMCQGNKLEPVRERFPDRFFDVGICESHAVAFAAGQCKTGLRPIVDIYSTFLQRSYDQIFQEVALQDLPVVFMLDRAGLTGPDGPTHHGLFDIGYLRVFPNMVCMAPAYAARNGFDACRPLWRTIIPAACDTQKLPRWNSIEFPNPIEIGQSEVIREGSDGTIVAFRRDAGTSDGCSGPAGRRLGCRRRQCSIRQADGCPDGAGTRLEMVDLSSRSKRGREWADSDPRSSSARSLKDLTPAVSACWRCRTSSSNMAIEADLLAEHGLSPQAIAQTCREAVLSSVR